MAKPTIYNISAFDAAYEHTFTFSYNGNQPFSNTCIIRNNATGAIVYQASQETMQLKHTIPAGSLTNGILYNVRIYITDHNGTVSDTSSAVLFYCYSSPTLTINNLIENQVVRNASYEITLTYNQAEGEELQYYQVLLYNTNKNQIWTSGVTYNTSVLSAALSSLEDNGVYYIRGTGSTINGMEVDTGYIYFSVNYIQPNVYALINLESLKDEGSVKIQSNIVALSMKYYGGNPVYTGEDYIDLTASGNYIYVDEDFSLDDNFTINIKGYNFTDRSTILQITNGDRTIKVNKRKGTFASEGNVKKLYFELVVPNAVANYYAFSNNLEITDTAATDILSIWLRRIDNVYSIYAENLSEN